MTPQSENGGLRIMVCCSAVVHLIVYFFLIEFHFSAHFKEAPVYYVDILALPVANPQAGSPAKTEGPPIPSPPAAPVHREMIMPAKPPVGPKPAPPQKKTEAAESAREFEERIARLEREAAARHAAETLKLLKEKVTAARGPVGMPGGKGSEAGSDYAGYIRSRLEDAFHKEDTFRPDPGKTVVVRLTIDQNGRIIGQRYEQRSSDRMFNDAVDRAIIRAEKDFKRPPGGGRFEYVYAFKPQGVGKK